MTEFNQDKPIFLQIADRICGEIVVGKYSEDGRIPSVRDYGVMLQVNVNTAVKAYEELARAGIIYQRRGMGYYVTAGAVDRIREQRRHELMTTRLHTLFREMQLLDVSLDEVMAEYERFRQGQQ